MDNRRLVIAILVSMGLMIGWLYVHNLLRQAHPEWFAAEEPAPATQPAAPAADAPGIEQKSPAPIAPAEGALRVAGAEAEAAEIGHAAFDPKGESRFPTGLRIDPMGAGVEAVTLNRFRMEVDRDDPYIFQRAYESLPPARRGALATRSVVVNGRAVELWNVPWRREEAGEASAMYAVEIRNEAGEEILRIRKRYELFPVTDQTLGYELRLTCSFENLTEEPAQVRMVFNGPHVPPVENSRDIPEVVVGYNDEQTVLLKHFPGTDFSSDEPAMSLKGQKDLPLLWAGLTSAYFNAIVRPETAGTGPDVLQDVSAQALAKRTEFGQEFLGFTFETVDLSVSGGGAVSVPLRVYFGPRQRAVLNSAHYEAFPLGYDATLVLTGGFCGICTFHWLVGLLVGMLRGFHFVARDWGLAIIALVVLVRLLLHPITKRSQISMSKMAKMGPEVERLKKKYGDNKEELNKAMMAFYKEQGFTPVLGCLPMLLQMPIWIALWSSLQSTFELRHAPFLWGMTWIDDLAQPDRLLYWPGVQINLFFFKVDAALNLLPLLMGVVFWLQQRLMPQPAAATPEQEQQRKMMMWMSLLFPALLYSGPSGLNLYILTSTAIGIWESKRVRDHLKAQEEAEKAGRVFVETKGTRASRRRAKEEQKPAEPKGCLMGWLQELQAKAEEVRNTASGRQRRERR